MQTRSTGGPNLHIGWVRAAEARFRLSRRLLGLQSWLGSRSGASAHPTADRARALAERCRTRQRDQARFFLRAIDRDNGGYLEDEADGRFYDRGEKRLLQQARQLWYFSMLAEEQVEREEALAAARHGFDFLAGPMRDAVHGGFYDRAATDGTPRLDLKIMREQCHALLAISTFARVDGDPRALALAEEVFQTFEARARDPGNGGYVDCLRRDWSASTPAETAAFRTVHGARSFDSELHVIEALCSYLAVIPSEAARHRLHEMLLRGLLLFRHPRSSLAITFWHQSTDRPVQYRRNLQAAVGHDLEFVWIVLDALRALGLPETSVRLWARQVCDEGIRDGCDRRHGGFFDRASFNGLGRLIPDREKVWWVQAECMMALLEMYRLTGEPGYFALFEETFIFVEQHFMTKDGGWVRSVTRDGRRVIDPVRASQTQGGYHSGRALARSAALLDRIAEDAAHR